MEPDREPTPPQTCAGHPVAMCTILPAGMGNGGGMVDWSVPPRLPEPASASLAWCLDLLCRRFVLPLVLDAGHGLPGQQKQPAGAPGREGGTRIAKDCLSRLRAVAC